MSSISVNTITDASGGATTSINGFTPSVSNMAGRNRIINGDMRIDQRNAGAEVNPVTNASYGSCDRLMYWTSQVSKFKAQQNAGGVTPPQGFSNYVGLTSLSAYTLNSTDYFQIQQTIEGFNWADLNWGTANAKIVTLSFWVRSSLTGTFGGSILSNGNDYIYPFSYTIPTANTWVKIELTITPPTSGTWGTTNNAGATLIFSIGHGSTRQATAGVWTTDSNIRTCTGQTSVVGTSGATFYITGVQLEEGSVATPFEHRQYGQELALCQRYYWDAKLAGGGVPYLWATTIGTSLPYYRCNVYFPVAMRAAPTLTITAATNGTFQSGMPNTDTASITSVVVNCDLNQTSSAYAYVTSLKASAEL